MPHPNDSNIILFNHKKSHFSLKKQQNSTHDFLGKQSLNTVITKFVCILLKEFSFFPFCIYFFSNKVYYLFKNKTHININIYIYIYICILNIEEGENWK